MALRVYIDGYLQSGTVMRDPGVTVTRELDAYSSRAEFRLKLPYADARPQVSQHVVIRDDVQMFRNSNRLDQDPWQITDVDAPTATWGALPSQVGGNGLRWEVTENATDGSIWNETYLVEHPLVGFDTQTGARETRYFVASMFIERGASPTHECTITLAHYNGGSFVFEIVDFNVSDGSFTQTAGTGDVYVDDADANWWRVVIVSTMVPNPTAVVMPFVQLFLQPRGTVTTCCWQLSELSSTALGLIWDEASMTWDEADFSWESVGPFGENSALPDYQDRRNVSANEFLGIIGDAKVSWLNRDYVFVDILAVDYRVKMRRTLVTETYAAQTDEAIITDLLTTYAPYLTALYTGSTVTLSFTWANKPLDECLEEITAQTGKPWRILPEARLQYGPARVDSVGYTFGDSHNLLEWSNDPSTTKAALDFDSGWNEIGSLLDATVTAQDMATPFPHSRLAWQVEDNSAVNIEKIRAMAPVTGLGDTTAFGGLELGQARTFAVGLYVKKGSATNDIVTLEAISFTSYSLGTLLATKELNATTGAITGGGTLTAIEDEDGDEWFLLSVEGTAAIGDQAIGFDFTPARATTIGGSDDSSLTGTAIISHAFIQLDGETRYVETGAFTSYQHDNTNWDMSVAGESLADLVNRITVKSDEAGTYSHTAEDTDSQTEYGTWEAVLIDSNLGSNAACQNRAEQEIALKAWPREAVTIECWYKTNLDVGMLCTVAQRNILQSRAVGQVIQRYTLRYRNSIDQRVTLECAPFSDDKVIKTLRKALATAT